MIKFPYILGILGSLVLGIVGSQYLSIERLESEKERLITDLALYKDDNEQHKLDLLSSNRRFDEARKMLEHERAVSKRREILHGKAQQDLRVMIKKLRDEVPKDELGAVCMRSNLPSYAIRLLDNATSGDCDKDCGEKSKSTTSLDD